MILNEEWLNQMIIDWESEKADFKKEFHDNKASLVHDVLCLSNALVASDRFLILGVGEDKIISGVSGDANRKNQAQIIDLLRNANFNHLPTLYLKTINTSDGKEVDVLIIRNLPEKPYSLAKDYSDRGKTVRSGVVYSRNGDTNTPIDRSVDDNKLEQMFKERLSIDKTPLERVSVYLRDIENWKYGYNENNDIFFYYEPYPEFSIQAKHDSGDTFEEPWVFEFPDTNAKKEEFFVKYHTTILKPLLFVWCDGCRYLTVVPDKDVFPRGIGTRGTLYETFFFVKDEINTLVTSMVQSVYKISSASYIAGVFGLFDSENEAQELLENDFNNGMQEFIFYSFDSDSKKYKRNR